MATDNRFEHNEHNEYPPNQQMNINQLGEHYCDLARPAYNQCLINENQQQNYYVASLYSV